MALHGVERGVVRSTQFRLPPALRIKHHRVARRRNRQVPARRFLADTELQSLDISADGLTINWYRADAAPELIWTPTLFLSEDGECYRPLAAMTRIANGWSCSMVDVPAERTVYLRIRARIANHPADAAFGLVESTYRIFRSGKPSF